MRVYMVNDHIRHSYLLGIHKMTKSSTTESPDGVTNGKKILKYVDTRWISLKGPDKRLFNEYASLVGVMYEHRLSVEKSQTLLFLLTDI